MTKYSTETRNIYFSQQGDSERLTAELSNLDGVIGLLMSEDWLEVSYDATKIQWKSIEQAITNNQFEVKPSLLSKWKRSWYQYSDENIRDNFNHKPHCCNKSPK
ncbi:hypothetical protein [Neptuniibacter marinus]|jgi:hypothetical protein|uniref:hypothetical protein n=1 Tax=Neptuniibacter marinus TaxID=1806670 RepID=UPI00082A1EEF|nr:hypothetical protein [Neptuniibacter marinus]|tara:strand:+ start:290 stop:601 length:312 start_codon:yes stop_codon:yes gene_type:complete